MRRNADAGLRKLTASKKRPTLSGMPAFAYYCIPFRHQQYKRAECIHFDASSIDEGLSVRCTLYVHSRTVYLFTLGKFYSCQTVLHPVRPVPDWTKMQMPMPEPGRYWNALVPDWVTGGRNDDADAQRCKKACKLRKCLMPRDSSRIA